MSQDTEEVAIVASRRDLPTYSINAPLLLAKAAALEKSALIGKVSDADSKVLAVRAQMELKRIVNAIEKARKTEKEPLLQAGRALDNLCASESLELEKEFGRVSNVVKEFDDAERRRVMEEERLQREEIARIEREKQAEIVRIEREQKEREEAARKAQEDIDRKAREAKELADRKAREEREAVEKLAREATNKKEREAAEKAHLEAEQRAEVDRIELEKLAVAMKAERERVEADLKRQSESVAAQTALIEEKAGDAAYCAAKPIEITKVAGQRQSTNWIITIEQPFVLAKYHPDLVDIKPRLGDIKQRLNEGIEVKGIKAVRETISGVRLSPERKIIEV